MEELEELGVCDPCGSGYYPASCGHDDPLGHLTGLPCAKCTKKNHNKALGR